MSMDSSETMLSHLDMVQVLSHYKERRGVHQKIAKAFADKDASTYANLALGISDPTGNYSAAEHHLGNMILAVNGGAGPIFLLGQKMEATAYPKQIPELLTKANLKYLKISVGSEMSMLLQPDKFWTTNVRTVWAHLLIENGDDYEKANEALSIYRGNTSDKNDWDAADMSYKLWADIHVKLETSLKRLGAIGIKEADKQGVVPGKLRFLWADAIANELYSQRT